MSLLEAHGEALTAIEPLELRSISDESEAKERPQGTLSLNTFGDASSGVGFRQPKTIAIVRRQGGTTSVSPVIVERKRSKIKPAKPVSAEDGAALVL